MDKDYKSGGSVLIERLYMDTKQELKIKIKKVKNLGVGGRGSAAKKSSAKRKRPL